MNDFFNNNRKEVRLAFIFSSICTSGFTLLLLFFAYLNNQFPANDLLIKIIIVGCLGFPLFIMCLVISITLFKMHSDAKAYAKLDKLKSAQISIKNELVFTDSKWLFTQEARKLVINGQDILCYIGPLDHQNVRFEILSQSHRSHSKIYKKRHFKKMPLTQLKEELMNFTNQL